MGPSRDLTELLWRLNPSAELVYMTGTLNKRWPLSSSADSPFSRHLYEGGLPAPCPLIKGRALKNENPPPWKFSHVSKMVTLYTGTGFFSALPRVLPAPICWNKAQRRFPGQHRETRTSNRLTLTALPAKADRAVPFCRRRTSQRKSFGYTALSSYKE